MVAQATLTVDLGKIAENARRIVEMLPGVEVVGVTKVTCASPEVARAMLDGGCVALGDSRLENLQRLRAAGIGVPLWLLRAPTPDLAAETVRLADVSLESELVTLAALDGAAAAAGVSHEVVAMVDLGDLREGMMPTELPAFLAGAAAFEHVAIVGLGTSLTCYGAVVPTADNLGELVELARSAEGELGSRMLVSGGMSSSLDAAIAGELPVGVDNLRVGESIVLGVSTVTREPIPGLHTDALVLEAPVIECSMKPTMPRGTLAQDAFGNFPAFEDRGDRRRAICAVGRQDAPPAGLRALDDRVSVLGASSDHLILDVDDLPVAPVPGDGISFIPNYAATLALFTSPYVLKRFVGG